MDAVIDEEHGLREALQRLKAELGVPGEGYPANVANAWCIADAALKGHRWASGDEQYANASMLDEKAVATEPETGEGR